VRRVAGVSSSVRAVAVVAALALSASACGGAGKADDAGKGGEDAASATSTTTAGDAASKDGSKPTEGDKAGAAGKKGSGATTTTARPGSKAAEGPKDSKTTPTTADPFRMTMPLTAEVSQKCVRPGGIQTVTLRAPVGAGLGFQVVYADGLQALMDGHYGGNAAGYTDEKGTFVDTFTVAATAPPGPAGVNALGTHMDHGFGEAHVHFAVADVLGNCRPEDMD
jgi:hypothetical protein